MSRELLDSSSKRIETLLDRFSAFPATTGARTDAEELVHVVSSLYGACLREVVEAMRLEFGERAAGLLEHCAGDPLIASLLVTHGLHPVSLDERVRCAVESVRDRLNEAHADAQVLSVDEDIVQIRVDGPADAVTVLEEAVHAAAPEVLEVRCVGQTISLLSAR